MLQAHHKKWLGQNPTSPCLVQTWHTGSCGTNNAAGNTLDRVGLANQCTVCVLVLCMLLLLVISCEAREMFVDTCGQLLLKTDITHNSEALLGQLETCNGCNGRYIMYCSWDYITPVRLPA